MPTTFTHSPAETERKEPGIGGKPPVDRRPTGGGGGGGDDDWQNERRGPRELLHRIRFFVFFALAGDMMFFAGAGGAVLRTPGGHAHGSAHPRADRRLASDPSAAHSLSQYRSSDAEQPDDGVCPAQHLSRDRRARRVARTGQAGSAPDDCPGLAATLALGALFLGGPVDGVEATDCAGICVSIAGRHRPATSSTSSPDCMRPILWWDHCPGGLPERARLAEAGGVAPDRGGRHAWYWHTMGLAWVVLLAVLTLGQ